MNIAVTNRCTRRCPFCYQTDVMDRAAGGPNVEMSVDNFRSVIDFIVRSGDHSVNLVGGEPTIHRCFAELMQIAGDNSSIHQILLFTNGIFNTRTLAAIAQYARKTIISVNVLTPGDETPARLKAVRRTFSRMRERGIRFDLSFVVYRPDFDYQFLLAYVEEFRITAVRWALAYPVVDGAAFVEARDLKTAGTRVAAMLRDLGERDVRTYVDCPLPYCMFSDEELGFVSRQALSVINWGYCGLTLEVDPDLTIKACPSQLERERVPLATFENARQLERFFFSRMSIYKAAHRLLPECETCRYFQQQRCQGGCLAYSKGVYDHLPLTVVETLTAPRLQPSWRVRPLPHLAIRWDDAHAVLISERSPQVAPEDLDDEGRALWLRIGKRPTVAELVDTADHAGAARIERLLRRFQRGGFIDLVPPEC